MSDKNSAPNEEHPATPQEPSIRSVSFVVDMVRQASHKLTPLALEKKLCNSLSLDRRQAKRLIATAVARQGLVYTYQFGNSFLEPSFQKPVLVGRQVMVTPPETSCTLDPGQVKVILQTGAAFGRGDHPSTRLAIQGIETAVNTLENLPDADTRQGTVLDIGTGSGVLVIAAVALGLATGIGIDIDPCALAEAKANVGRNHLSKRIRITSQPLESLSSPFSLVCANLRIPTLKAIAATIGALTHQSGQVVLSGIRSDETEGLVNLYASNGFQLQWSREEGQWAAVVLKKMG